MPSIVRILYRSLTHGAIGTLGAHGTSETNRNISFVNKTIDCLLTSTKKNNKFCRRLKKSRTNKLS